MILALGTVAAFSGGFAGVAYNEHERQRLQRIATEQRRSSDEIFGARVEMANGDLSKAQTTVLALQSRIESNLELRNEFDLAGELRTEIEQRQAKELAR